LLQRLRLGQRPETGVHLEKEIEKATGYLDPIEATRKIYVCGNHEDRLERYLKDKAPELLAFVDIPRLLGLAERGWEYVLYRSSTTLGKGAHHPRRRQRRPLQRLESPRHLPSVSRHRSHAPARLCGRGQRSRQTPGFSPVRLARRHFQGRLPAQVKAQREWALGFGYGLHDTHTGVVYLTPAPIVNYSVAIADQVLRR
jgi:hypothetical protein